MPVIPPSREAEAGESLEPRRQRLQWAETVPLHSSLGNKSETPSQKKKEKKKSIIQEYTGSGNLSSMGLKDIDPSLGEENWSLKDVL